MNNHRNYVLVSLKALVAAVLLVAAAFTLYLYIGGFDDVAGLSLDDADLIVELDDVPDDENAFLTFMSATNYYFVASDYRADLDDNQFLDYGVAFTNEAYYAAKARSLTNAAERAEAILASNETFFATMSKGVRQKYYRNVSPRVPPFETFSMPPITTFVAVARLLRLKAQRELERGELDAATDTIADIHAFGRLVMENELSSVGYHLGSTIQCYAYGGMRDAVGMGLATDAMLERFLKLVKADAAAADADVARAIRGEYTTIRSGVDCMTRSHVEAGIDYYNHLLSLLHGILYSFFGCDYSPSWTGRITEAFYRVILRWPGYMRFALHPRATKARLIQTARRAIAGEGLTSEQMNRTLFAPNCFGNGISYVLGSAVRASGKTASGFRFAQTKTMVILAVEEWRLNNGGGNPPTLDVLVPEFLPKVPVGPWGKDRRPLSYHPEDGVVWSVGRLGLFNYIKYLEAHPVAKKCIHKELRNCAFRIDGRPF